MSDRGEAVWRHRRGVVFSRSCKIGSTNAAVLPVPVGAQPMMSFPARARGIAFFWISVGVVYPDVETLRRIASDKPIVEKLITFLHEDMFVVTRYF